jgi:exopolyphosphatase/guanosine-5'-triphosphate,3'-diphosphate pyrophosphatase
LSPFACLLHWTPKRKRRKPRAAVERRELAARLKDWQVTATGDGPPLADAESPAMRAAEANTGGAGNPVHSPGKSHGGGASKSRKHRRRRRRGPVYAPGMRPEGPAERSGPDTAVVGSSGVQPAARAARQPLASASDETAFYAALDLGTNNCRLLIASPRDHGFRVVDAFSRIVRLGEGIGQTGRLGEAAMARSIEALRICKAKLDDKRVARARLIATEACRTAENGPEFVDRVRAETGLSLEIVSRETEARLAVAGCASLVDPTASGVILFDIGGGSSELVWIDLAAAADGRRRRMADRIRSWMSLPVGVVNLSERHGGRHVARHQFDAMVAEVQEMLDGFPEAVALGASVAAGNVHMLGTSGTVTTLAGVHLELPRYDRRRVDGTWLSGGEVTTLVAALAAMDYDSRVAHPCIGRERADLVLAGCAILEAIRARWPCERLRVADRGLREGVLVELMSEDGVWRPRSGRRGGERRHG